VSPRVALIFGSSVGLMLAGLGAFGWVWEAISLGLGAYLLVALLPQRMGREVRDRSTDGLGPEPAEGHLEVRAGLLLMGAPLLILLVVPGAVGFIHVAEGDQGVVLAMLVIATVVLYLILLSTLMDWYYVLPSLRGGRGTICATSMNERWRSVTRAWLLHRAGAVYGGIAGVTALVSISANSWVRPIDEIVAGVIAAVATIIVGYYLTRAALLVAIAGNPPVQVGDVIEIAEEFNVHEPEQLREYFVVDVALEGVKLLNLDKGDVIRRDGPDAKRTHDRMVDVMEIAKLLRKRRPARPCSSGCQYFTEHCACDRPWAPVAEDDQPEAMEAA
jgi:hypothetical protein